MFDNQLKLSSAQAVTVTAISDEVIDMDDAAHLVAEGRPLYVYIYLTTAFAASTSTITVDLNEAADANVATKVQELIAATDANADPWDATGLMGKFPLPIGKITTRYVGLKYTVTGASAIGTGIIDAYLAP